MLDFELAEAEHEHQAGRSIEKKEAVAVKLIFTINRWFSKELISGIKSDL